MFQACACGEQTHKHVIIRVAAWPRGLLCAMGNDSLGELGAFVGNRQDWISWIRSTRTTVKAFAKDVCIYKERKIGDRRRTDTVVILTVHDADKRLGGRSFAS